jgi:hypothetical protein
MSTDSPQSRLEALAELTADVDAANPSMEQRAAEAQEEKQAAAVDQAAKDWGYIPFTIGSTLAMIAPELKAVYTEEACLQWGTHAAAVAEKYGWKSPASPEIALAACTLQFAVPSVLIVREKLREMREGKATGLLAKVGVWWRTRKAAKAAEAAKGDGGDK